MTSFSTLFVCFGGVLVVACGSSDTKQNAGSDASTDADRGALGASVPANAVGDVQIGHVTRDFVERAVHGFYSEMRLSKVARYVANFTPAAHLATDTDTTAFWKFDEGTGTTIADSSGNANAGTITGPTWLSAPCR